MSRRLLLFPVLAALLPATALALDADEPFAVEACGAPVSAANGKVEIPFQYQVFKDHFIYRDMSSVTVKDAGGITFSEAVFPAGHKKFDKVSESEREIFEESFVVKLAGALPEGSAGPHAVQVEVKWQGCNKPDNYCLFPETKEYSCQVVVGGDGASEVAPEVSAPDEPSERVGTTGEPTETAAVAAASENCDGTAGQAGFVASMTAKLTGWLERVLAGEGGAGFMTLLLVVFLGGLASSLTPCVYPMIPITISVIGASADQGKLKSFSLAVTYVLGIAATYTVLGLVAAYSGGLFGEMMQNPFVIGGVAAVFLGLAAAMFGFYEFALPSSVTTRASMVGGGGYPGAFVVGTVAGVVAAPCTGPIVALLLVKIASDYTVAQGVAIMLAYSLGLGQIFLLIGTFAGMLNNLPRSGMWMVEIKHLFGVVMVGVALWYLAQILPPSVMMALWIGYVGLVAFEVAGRMTAIKGPRNLPRVAAGLAALLIGLFLALAPEEELEGLAWQSDHDGGISLSSSVGKPMILDFTADWCAACKELEHLTYTDPAVIDCAAEFVPVMVDATDTTPEFERLKDKYEIRGLPAVFFVCPQGNVVKELTLKGFEPADQFLDKMNRAIAACG